MEAKDFEDEEMGRKKLPRPRGERADVQMSNLFKAPIINEERALNNEGGKSAKKLRASPRRRQNNFANTMPTGNRTMELKLRRALARTGSQKGLGLYTDSLKHLTNPIQSLRLSRRFNRQEQIKAEMKPTMANIFGDRELDDASGSQTPLSGSEVEDAPPEESNKRVIYTAVVLVLVCSALLVLLIIWAPEEYDSELLTSYLNGYDVALSGKLCSIPCSVLLSDKQFEVINVKLILSELQEPDTEVTIGWKAVTGQQESEILGSAVLVDDGQRSEFLEFHDIGELKNMTWEDGNSFFEFVYLDTPPTNPTAVIVEVLQMSSFARYRLVSASILLVAVYLLIALEIVDRLLIVLIGSFLSIMLVAMCQKSPSLANVVIWLDEGTLSHMFGMMVIVAMLSVTGVFEWMAVRLVRVSSKEVDGSEDKDIRIVSMFKLTMAMGLFPFFLSAFLSNVTLMLLVSPVSIRVCEMLVGENDEAGDENDLKSGHETSVVPKDDTKKEGHDGHEDAPNNEKLASIAVPLLMVNGILSNMGGCLTLIGAIPNIIIGYRLQEYISFMDFLIYLAPGILLTVPFVLAFIRWYFSESLVGEYPVNMKTLYSRYKIKDTLLLTKVGITMIFVVLAFFMNPIHSKQSGWIACFGAVFCLALAARDDVAKVLDHVEWDTLLFFGGLFVLIAALQDLGLIREIGNLVSLIIEAAPEEYRLAVACTSILWLSALVSGFLSNIAFAATMAPVIKIVGENPDLNLPVAPLAWALCFGTSLGGNLTLIGSAANLIAAGVASHNGMKMTFWEFFKVGAPVWLITNIVVTIYMLVVFVWLDLA